MNEQQRTCYHSPHIPFASLFVLVFGILQAFSFLHTKLHRSGCSLEVSNLQLLQACLLLSYMLRFLRFFWLRSEQQKEYFLIAGI